MLDLIKASECFQGGNKMGAVVCTLTYCLFEDRIDDPIMYVEWCSSQPFGHESGQ